MLTTTYERYTQIFKAEKIAALPRLNLNDRQICDLELLTNGGFTPLNSFLNEDDYISVVDNMRLGSGELWPIPITLDVSSDSVYKTGDDIVLCDQYGEMLAVLSIESVYEPDKTKEAEKVFGTIDKKHPGVFYLFERTGNTYIGGKLQKITLPQRYDFSELRKTPEELKKHFKEKKWDRVVGFQTRNPVHRAHFELMKRAADKNDAQILIHPVIGVTKEGDFDYITRVHAYKAVRDHYMNDFAELSLLPLAMRMAGPREALLHALIRKNYGCTHFIIGRDHAGPGNDSSGKPFYGAYDAQELAKKYENDLGVKIIPFNEMVYVEEEKKYIPNNEVKEGQTVKNISGTKLRKILRDNDVVPEWISFPEVINELKKGVEKEKKKGYTIFFTGLSGSGKSTIAHKLYTKLLEIQDRSVTLLDGDVVRQNLSKGLGFSKADRDANVERIGFVANEITKHGGIAICSLIAPYIKSRRINRELISGNGTYIEVHVSTSLDICKDRDPKGLYKRVEVGKIKGFTGIDDPYEAPEFPEIKIDTEKHTSVECVDLIIESLKEKDLI